MHLMHAHPAAGSAAYLCPHTKGEVLLLAHRNIRVASLSVWRCLYSHAWMLQSPLVYQAGRESVYIISLGLTQTAALWTREN